MTTFNPGAPQLVTPTTAGNQSSATVIALAGGGSAAATPYGNSVIVQIFDASGQKVGAPVELPDQALVTFGYPYKELLPLAGGGYAFMWSTTVAGESTVWGQTVDSGGHAQPPVQIAANMSLYIVGGAALADGGYVVGFLVHDASNYPDYSIVTQRVDAANQLEGAQLTVATGTLESTEQASLDWMFGTPDGGYLVGPVIQTDHPDPADTGMPTQRHSTFGATLYKVDADGQPTGASLSAQGATAPDLGGGYPVQVQLANGDMAMSTLFDRGAGHTAFQVRVLTSDGRPVGEVVIQNGDSSSSDFPLGVIALAGGNFLVSFEHTQDTSPGSSDPMASGRYFRTYDGSGHPLGDFMELKGALHALSDGGLLMTDGQHTARYLDATGVPSGEPVALPQEPGIIVPTADGGFIYEYTVSGDSGDAYVQDFNVSGASSSGAMIGTNGDDHLVGTPGNDRMDGIRGNDTLDGGAGTDTAVIETSVGGVQSYSIGAGGTTVTTALGTDTLVNIERVQFSDAMFALDTNPGGHVWEAAALFHAGFGVLPGMADLSHWTARADQSSGMGELAQEMIDAYAPGVSSQALVAWVYQQLTHEAPTADVVQGFADQVGAGRTFATQGDLLAYAANLSLNTDAVAGIVGTVQQLDPQAF